MHLELTCEILFQGDSISRDWLRNKQKIYCVAFLKWDTRTPIICWLDFLSVLCTAVLTDI